MMIVFNFNANFGFTVRKNTGNRKTQKLNRHNVKIIL